MPDIANSQTANDRRKRINRLKKIILAVVAVLIFIPIILCIILSVRVCSLEGKLDELLEMKEKGLLVTEIDAKGNVHVVIKDDTIISADIDDSTESTEVVDQNVTQPNSEIDGEVESATDSQDATQGRGEGKVVYLTFDDGPSENTEKIIKILDSYGVKATFFVVGKEDQQSKELYKMIVDSGNTIALHSYSHRYDEIYSSVDAFAEDVKKVHDVVYEATGVDVKYYRFPGGSANSYVTRIDIFDCIDYLNDNGYRYYDWNVSSGDATFSLVTVDSIMDNVNETLFNVNTAIILMHDSAVKTTTVEALPELIDMLLAEGFEIKAIDDSTPTIQQIKSQ